MASKRTSRPTFGRRWWEELGMASGAAAVHARPNPDEATERQILEWARAKMPQKEIASRTGLTTRTIRRVLQKRGFERTPAKERKLVLEMSKEGYSAREIGRQLNLPRRSVDRIIAASREKELVATVKERVTEREGPSPAALQLLKRRMAAQKVEFDWTVAVSKMLLLPAQDLPPKKRIERLQAELRKGLEKVKGVRLEGRDLGTELRKVAAYALEMMQETPEGYQRRYRRGGVRPMLAHADKVVSEKVELPAHAAAISEFVALATLPAVAPGTRRVGMDPETLEKIYAMTAAPAPTRDKRERAALREDQLLIEEQRRQFFAALSPEELQRYRERMEAGRLRHATAEEQRRIADLIRAGWTKAQLDYAAARSQVWQASQEKAKELRELARRAKGAERERLKAEAEVYARPPEGVIDTILRQLGVKKPPGLKRNPATPWGDDVFLRTNASLLLGLPFESRPRRSTTRAGGRKKKRRSLSHLLRY